MDRVEDLLARIDAPPEYDDLARTLVTRAVELGGSDDEILLTAHLGQLGPLLLDLTLRPVGETMPVAEFAERSLLEADFVRRTWAAFGLPSEGRVPLYVTPDAADAVHAVHFLADHLGDDAALGIARVVGAATAALAEAVANATRVGVEVPGLDAGVPYVELNAEMAEVARELLPALWDAIGAVFRRHLVLVSYQKWTPDADRAAVVSVRSIGFVDLVGSTEALRSQSVAELAASVDHFEQLVWDIVGRAGGRVVKLIGDEAMFTVESPAAACALARELVATSRHPVRVGLAHGEIVALHGDCYGPTVNLAARLVAVAPPGEVIVDAGVRAALDDEDAAGLEPFATGPLRGFPELDGAYRLLPS